MEFIKKNLFLILCVAIVLAGGGLFVPGYLIGAGNREAFDAIGKQAAAVDNARRGAVHDDELAREEQNLELATADSDAVVQAARETTRRPLIYDAVFPKLQSEVYANRKYHYGMFADNYIELVEGYLGQMRAGDRPSQADENRVRQEYQETAGRAVRSDSRTATRWGEPGLGGGGIGPGGAGSARRSSVSGSSQEEKLIEDLRRQRAGEISVYASADAFCRYDYWLDGWQEVDVEDEDTMVINGWFTQIAAWVQEDVAAAIAEVNGDSQSVAASAVKRLVEISFGGAEKTSGKGTRSSGAGQLDAGVASRRLDALNLPQYVVKIKASREDEVEGNIAAAWTGHVGNELIDVVHFETAVIIDTTRISDFTHVLRSKKYTKIEVNGQELRQNERNQIVILQMVLDPVDVEAEDEAGYYYGAASLGVLRLTCQYSFFKAGYEGHVPDAVKKLLEPEEESASKRSTGRTSSTRKDRPSRSRRSKTSVEDGD